MNFTGVFFSEPANVLETIQFHRRLVDAIAKKNAFQAVSIMMETLHHGESHLRSILNQPKRRRP
jgi:DNA-binding FadR family transcriptional regulator